MPNTSNNQLEVDDIYAIGEERSRRRSSTKEPLSYTNKAIDKFSDAIQAMNEAVLIPSKLRDIQIGDLDLAETNDLEMAPKSDLYQYYTMLNQVKDDLFNGISSGEDSLLNGLLSSTNHNNNNTNCLNNNHLGHNTNTGTNGVGGGGGSSRTSVSGHSNGNNNNNSSNNRDSNGRWDRQQSDDAFNSLTSLSSLTVSLDGLTVEPVVCFEDRANQLMSVFMQHLHDLYGILQHFTKAAHYITKRYQQEISSADDQH